MRVPGGGVSFLGVGRPGSGALPPPTARLLGGLPGPTTHWLWVRGAAGVGTRHQPHSARSCVLWGRHEGARGGRLFPGCWASGVGRSPIPDCPPSGRAAGAHYPLAVDAGGCGLRDPSPTPQRVLLRAGFARYGGGMRAPGGGASCLGLGRPGSGALPPRTARPLGGLPGPTTHWLWVRGGAGVGTRHQAHSARSCVLWERHEAARGGRFLPGCGKSRGRALSHPRLPTLWAGCRGPLPTGCGCGGVRAWGPVTNPTARALASWLCALWGRHEGARGGRLLPGCGASGVGRSPIPDCPPSGRAAGAHYPLAVGAGGCERRDPSPTPQRALLRAGFARCGGGMRVPGGAPLACVWGVRGRALSHPRLPAFWAACRGPLPTGCVRGGVRAWGPVTNPTARALACCGSGMRVPGGGASCLGVGRPGSGALPPPTARPLGGLPGPTTHWLWVRGDAGVGTRHQPHSARSCVLWGRHEGAGGGRLFPGCGASGVGRSPTPDCPPSGRAAGAHHPLAVGAGGSGVGSRHQPHSTRSCVLWGRLEGARGGGPLAWVWGVRGGRSATPNCPPSGRAAGAHYPLAVRAGGFGRGDPSPTPQRALLRAGFARCGGGVRVPGGGASCLGVGHPGSGALPPPTARPLGGLPGPTTHWLWMRGGAGMGNRHQPHSARSCELALRTVGEARGRPGGAPPAWVWGVRGLALSNPRLPALWPGCRGPLPTGCGCGGVRLWGPVTNPTARALACSGSGMGVPGGGTSCLGVGRPGSGALPPPPTARLLGGLPGPTTHLLWVRGGAGVGTRHQPHSARSCELALRAVGGA